ncbi:hypothetical protein DHEL01_v210097 [Diaporthe helianthi]|uniref:Rhodopsin domain-containing protein n=1 Tax=Diaporthe helianthi TaxID=158607 RepID=A0A2P5HMP1_DIAHE|nr:hypothetical protein DHEL01_v210097 [Diaporthe helianthi]
MGFHLHDRFIGISIFFIALCTATVGLRVFVRTKLTKRAFGWDDVSLVISYLLLIVLEALCILCVESQVDSSEQEPWLNDPATSRYEFAKNVICFVISGVVKISVAIVLFRLDSRPAVRTIIIIDIVTCIVWNLVTALVLSLGCMGLSPYVISKTVCANTFYAQDSSYVIYDVFHVLLPIYILWNVQISKALKVSVVGLFSVGLIAAVAAIMKLKVHYETFHPRDNDSLTIWYSTMTWAFIEHGLSIFASSVLALRPLARMVSKRWQSISSSFYGGGSRGAKSSGGGTSSRVSRNTNWSEPTESNELGTIGVRNEVSVHSEYTAEGHAQEPLYLAQAYSGSSESHKRLVEAKAQDAGVAA